MPDRSIPPAARIPQKFLLPRAELHILGNDVPLHVLSIGDLPILKLEFVFRAGAWFETFPGNSFFTVKMLAEGTKRYSSSEIAAFIDQHGAFLELHSGPDYCSLELLTVERHLRSLLSRVFDIIHDPSFPEEELALLQMIQSQQLSVNLEKNSYVASRLFREKLYGSDHPYGRSLQFDTIDHQQKDSLQRFHREYLKNNFEIIVSGKVTDAVVRDIGRHFSDSDSYNPKAFEMLDNSYKKSSEWIARDGELQVSIRVGKPFPSRRDPEYTQAIVVNEILGGYFGSRLMQNIREEKGYTYGIHSSIVNQKSASHLVIGTDVKKEFAEETLREIYKEIAVLRNEAVAQEELDTVINYIKGSYLAGFTSEFSVTEKFKNIHYYDLDYDYYDGFFDRLDAVTPKDILYAAQKHFDPEAMSEVIVG